MSERVFVPEEDDLEDIRVTLELDEGDVECAILTIFELEDQNYIALVPVDDKDEIPDDGEVMLFRYSEDEDGNPDLSNIETDEEFDKVADFFDEFMEDQAMQDILDEE